MSNGSDAHLGTWLVVGVLIGLALALLLGVLALGARRVARARRSARTSPAPLPGAAVPAPSGGPAAAGAAFADDDLPGFAERPPGWTAESRVPSPTHPAQAVQSPAPPDDRPAPG